MLILAVPLYLTFGLGVLGLIRSTERREGEPAVAAWTALTLWPVILVACATIELTGWIMTHE